MRNLREDNVWSNHIQHGDKTYSITFFFPWSAMKVFEISTQIVFNKIFSCQGGLKRKKLLIFSVSLFFLLFLHPLMPSEKSQVILSPCDILMSNLWPLEQLSLSIFKSELVYQNTLKKVHAFFFTYSNLLLTYYLYNTLHNTQILYPKYWSMPSAYQNKKYKKQKCIGRKIERNEHFNK